MDDLNQLKVKATFFVVGAQVIEYPMILKQTFDQGHEICIHTWSHHSLTTMSTEIIVSELEYTIRAVQSVTGKRPNCMRPPFGDIDDRVRGIASAMGLLVYHWNYDTSDHMLSQNPNLDIVNAASEYASHWRERKTGVISLQHDLIDLTVSKAMPMIEAIKTTGMTPMSIAQCINPQSSTKNPNTSPSSPNPNTTVLSMAKNCIPSTLWKYTLCLL